MQKLVRDRIPELMSRTGIIPAVRVLAAHERLNWLLAKLNEETAELTKTPNLEECADVLEVVTAIAAELGYSFDALAHAASDKRTEKGGFAKGLVISTNCKPDEPNT